MRSIRLVKRRVDPAAVEGRGWEVRDAWIEDEIGDGWMVAFRVFEKNGELVVGEIRVFPEEPDEGNADSLAYYITGQRQPGSWSAENLGDRATPQIPGRGLTIRKLKDVHIEPVLRAARELIAKIRADEGRVDEALEIALSERRWTEEGFRSRRGPQANDDPFLAFVASIYVGACRDSRTPLVTAAAHPRIDYSLRHTKRLLKEARGRKLLTETEPRKAGGVLTEKGRAALETYYRREEKR